MSTLAAGPTDQTFGGDLSVQKMPAHWLFARLGKRVLRPGGIETTRWLVDTLAVGAKDDVVEFAPGLAVTARSLLARSPRSYVGVERDPEALQFATRALRQAGYGGARVVAGDAAAVPLEEGCASVVVGEAMLSMQTAAKKHAIMSEASRLLRPGGRYGIHELVVTPDGIGEEGLARIERTLSSAIHVGVRIGTQPQWLTWLTAHGFEIEQVKIAPMRLLEPDRMLRDEGPLGLARFVANAVRTPGAVERLRAVRGAFHEVSPSLSAIAVVARRKGH